MGKVEPWWGTAAVVARGWLGGSPGPGPRPLLQARASIVHSLGVLSGCGGPRPPRVDADPRPLLGRSEVVDGVKGSGLRCGSRDVQPGVQGTLGGGVLREGQHHCVCLAGDTARGTGR